MDYKDILAKCFVIMSEVDYDLREWEKLVIKCKGRHGKVS